MGNSSAIGMTAVSTGLAGDVQPGFGRRVFGQWRRGAHAIGVVQTRFLMLLIYVLVVVPTGLVMKIARDPLHLSAPKGTNCVPHSEEEQSLDTARRQF